MKDIFFSNGGYQYLLQYSIKNNLKKYITKSLTSEYHKEVARINPDLVSNIGCNLQNINTYYGFYNTNGAEYQLIFLRSFSFYKGLMINNKYIKYDQVDEALIVGHELEILENTYKGYKYFFYKCGIASVPSITRDGPLES